MITAAPFWDSSYGVVLLREAREFHSHSDIGTGHPGLIHLACLRGGGDRGGPALRAVSRREPGGKP